MRTDRHGLGGFFEAILAVMIVTSGFTVLLVSVNLVMSSEDRETDGDARSQVRAICERLMADERIFRPPYVLLLGNSYLWSEIVEDEMSSFTNYLVTLIIDLEDQCSILLAQNGIDSSHGDVINARIPVDVQITPATVHVGILEVRVWI